MPLTRGWIVLRVSADWILSLPICLCVRVWYYLFQMRRLVQVILSLAALFRAIEIGLDLLILTPFKEAIEYPPYHAVADMLYISVYALLTLFWAQLCLVTMGNRKRILRHIFAIGLSSFCLLFGATVFVVAFSHLSTTLHKTLTCIIFAELGAANAIVGIILLYFGVRVINFTQKYGSIAVRKPWALIWLVICKIPKPLSLFFLTRPPRRHPALSRTICLTVLCSGACLLKFAVSITIATGTIQLQNDLNNPRKW